MTVFAKEAKADFKPGVFVGLIKDVEADFTQEEYNKYAAKTVPQTQGATPKHNKFNFPRLNYHAFPACCGTCIITGFPYQFGGEVSIGFSGNTQTFDRDINKAAFTLHVRDFLRGKCYIESRKSYVICTLNQAQMQQGNHEILVDYLNFSRLDDDFINRSGSQHVGVFGLCLNKFSPTNL